MPIQVSFLGDVEIIIAFLSLYSLFPNASKEDCTVVAKTSSAHPGLFFLRGATIIFAFRSLYSLFPNASKEDFTVVAKRSSAHHVLANVYRKIN